MTMLVVSSREFRDNQKAYFDRVDKGEQVIVQRGKNKSYKLVPVTDDYSCMTEQELQDKLNRALEQYEKGEYKTLTPEYQKELLGL